MKHCCSEPRKSSLSCVWLVCVGYHGRVICFDEMYVPRVMIPVLHTCNTRSQYSSFSGLQNQLYLLLWCTWNLAYDFKPFILTETWAAFLFYCINSWAVDFIQFILNVLHLFYYVRQQIYGLFQLCYRVGQKTEICANVASVSFQHLQFNRVVKYIWLCCGSANIVSIKFI